MQSSLTEAEFEILVRRAGLTMGAEQRRVLHGVYGHVEAMLERVRTPRDRSAEPAHIFKPDQA